MAQTFTYTRRVEFADTDAAGLMHFSNFFRFMESAEHAFLRSLGHTVHQLDDDGHIGFVRVHAECDYRRPLRFEDEVDITLTVRDVNTKSIVYDFAFRPHNAPADAEALATGSLTVVCVYKDNRTQQVRAIDIPAPLAAQLKGA